MSKSNAGSRTAPKITLSENPEEDFNFYLQFVTPLIPKLPDVTERKLAEEWVQKMEEDSSNPKLRTEYLLLLLFALHRRKLAGPFSNSPSKTGVLKPFQDNLDVFQMMERMVIERKKTLVSDDIPPYYAEISGDLKDYVVTQDIPNGVHCYLATSNEPMEKWVNPHLAHIPKEPVQPPPGSGTPRAPTTDESLMNCSINLQSLQNSYRRASFWKASHFGTEVPKDSLQVPPPQWTPPAPKFAPKMASPDTFQHSSANVPEPQARETRSPPYGSRASVNQGRSNTVYHSAVENHSAARFRTSTPRGSKDSLEMLMAKFEKEHDLESEFPDMQAALGKDQGPRSRTYRPSQSGFGSRR